jgi:hypothetical protein
MWYCIMIPTWLIWVTFILLPNSFVSQISDAVSFPNVLQRTSLSNNYLKWEWLGSNIWPFSENILVPYPDTIASFIIAIGFMPESEP